METYIFLTNQYLPTPGATGLCVHQLAKEIAGESKPVYTICYDGGDSENEFDGVKVVRIQPPPYLQDNQSASDLGRKAQYIGSLFGKLIHIKDYPLRSNNLVKKYIKAIELILKNNDHATIVASYTPLEAVVATMKIKLKYNDRVKTVYYSTDTLSNEQGDDGILSAKYRTNCGIRWEKKLFKTFDKILIMECHKDHYASDFYRDFFNKMETVNFPLFCKLDVDTNETVSKAESNLRMVYTGTLYQRLRNPEFLNALIITISKIMPVDAFFLGGGDCEEIMHKAEVDSDNAIKYLGMQTHDVALCYIRSADVLLSIGNVESPMAPSKIYEYMSTGKPIIHIYTYDKDPCLEPLRKYGNALIIRQGENVDKERILEFLVNRHTLDYENVKQLFITSTAKFSIDIIRNS